MRPTPTAIISALLLAFSLAVSPAISEEQPSPSQDQGAEPKDDVELGTGITDAVAEADSVAAADTTAAMPEPVEAHPQDSSEERGFALITGDGKSQLRIRGSIRLNGVIDLKGLQTTEGFETPDIPVGEANRSELRFSMDARQTRLGIEAIRETGIGDAFLRIEADFLSDQNAFRLRHAYGSIASWTLGQTWSILGDLSALPLTVDLEGPNSAVSFRTPQIRYSWGTLRGRQVSLAAESPQAEFAGPDTLTSAFQAAPDFLARVRHETTWGHWQLAGVYRSLASRTTGGELNYSPGYGATVSGKVRIATARELFFQVVGGRSISRYISALAGRQLDLLFNPDTGKWEAVLATGGYFAVTQRLLEHTQVGFVAGAIQVENKAFQPDDAFRDSYYFAGNAFHDIITGTRLGIEYLYGRRRNKNGDRGNASRVQFMMYYDF